MASLRMWARAISLGSLYLCPARVAATGPAPTPAPVAQSYTINVGSVLELKDASASQDGTAGSSGDTCGMIGEASVAYIDAVNALNGGLGFEVLAGREQPLYFRLNYTQNNFDDGTYESVGADKAAALFPDLAFVMGTGAGCDDSITSAQALVARNASTIYMTSRGPQKILTENGANDYFFSIHLNSNRYPYLGLKQFNLQGATSVAIVYEDLGNYFFTGVGTESQIIAESFGYEVRLNASFGYTSDGDVDLAALETLLADAVGTEADVLVLCMRNGPAEMAFGKLKSMRNTHAFDMVWAPQPGFGLSNPTCVGMGVNCSYAVGATQISYQQADAYTDDLLGQSYTDFAASTSLDAASDFDNTDIYAGWSSFVQAVQTVFMFRSVDDPSTFLQDGTEYQLLVEYLRSGRYIGDTFHGVVAFNEYGQNEGRDPTTLQTQADGVAEVVFPSDFAEGIFSYPAPVGEECPDTYSTAFKGCLLCERLCTAPPPEVIAEEMNYLPPLVHQLGWTLVLSSWALAFTAIVWTALNRNHAVVRLSQPAFLVLIALGAVISTGTIIPMMVDDNNYSVRTASYNCMAFPWLYTFGFSLSTASLFAKMNRVTRIFSTHGLQRAQAKIMDVVKIVLGVVAFEFGLMLIWTITSPLEFVRVCEDEDPFTGACIESRSSCVGTNDLYKTVFIPVIGGVHLIFLLYVAYICWRARNIPTEFQEGRWISMSVFSNIQILLLGTPLVILLTDHAVPSFIVRAGIIWLNDCAVVAVIFGPKYLAVTATAVIEQPNQELSTIAEVTTLDENTMTSHTSSQASSRRNGSTSGSAIQSAQLSTLLTRVSYVEQENGGLKKSVRELEAELLAVKRKYGESVDANAPSRVNVGGSKLSPL